MLKRNNLRLVIVHLGNGASVSAVRNGICVDTSMGFTPLEGVVMGTRSGSVDPGLLIYLLRRKGLSVDQLDHALNYQSGLSRAPPLSEPLCSDGAGDPLLRIRFARLQKTFAQL